MYATMALYSVIVIGMVVANGMQAANIQPRQLQAQELPPLPEWAEEIQEIPPIPEGYELVTDDEPPTRQFQPQELPPLPEWAEEITDEQPQKKGWLSGANIAFWALIGGNFAIWLSSFMTGWIVRGFLNIPLGMDRRPQAYR
jgi:hypothetical protein